jgi:SAM-dependent methyltransferase
LIRTDHRGNKYKLTRIVCPTCGDAGARRLGLRGGAHQRYGFGFESTIYRCRRCGLIYPNPLPIPDDPSSLYGDPDSYFHQHASEEKQSGADWLVGEIARRTGKAKPALLDVGSGRGEVVQAAERLGSEAVGLELSKPMIDHAKANLGVSLRRATVEQFAADHPADSFDAVVAAAVLEHVYDPDSFMRVVARLLRPQGILFLDLPREPSLFTWSATLAQRLRARATVYYLSPSWEPFHLYGFNPKAIKALLAKHGLAVEELHVRSRALVSARADDRADAIRAFAGRQLVRIGNLTRSAPNMDLWARLT